MSEFPNKEERATCWGARDKYWICLDKFAPEFNRNNVKEKEPEACKELRKFYETGCPSQWVKHFDRKRTYELFKKRMEKGYDPLEKQQKEQTQ